MAIDTRKADITLRLSMAKKARDEREKKIEEAEKRKADREQTLADAEEQYYKDHEAQMEEFNTWEQANKAKDNEEYASEDEDDENKEDKEPPLKPEFAPADCEEKFDDENPVVEIPDEIPDEIDKDWVMSEDEIADLITKFWAEKDQ